MKVNKHPQVKAKAKSHKWKDVRGNRCRPPIISSDLNSSPVMTRVIREHQASLQKKKPVLKRLKNKARSVSEPQRALAESPHAEANGNSAFARDSDSDELQDWREYSQSFRQNGVNTVDEGEGCDGAGSRLEGRALHSCAERDDQRNHAVLLMQKDETLCFRGKCVLTCLYGRVEVMGFTVEEGHRSCPLFSPASHCPLTIRALVGPEDDRGNRARVSDILQRFLPPASHKKFLRRVSPYSSLILLEPMETPLTRFLSSFREFSELFSPTASELMSAVLDTPLNGLGMIPLLANIEGLKVSPSCSEALDMVIGACRGDMDGCAVILVYGTKNVGKSTFIRLLINSLLNHTPSVDYLEGDVGQTEFTPCGCLSLLTLTEPLLGPPFTHQRAPDHMVYYGQSSCESDLDRYLDSIKSLWHRRSPSREAPIVINTMGWVKGFGFDLLVDLVRILPVSHVVQLGHSGTTQCPALTPEFLHTAHGYQTHPPAPTAREFTEDQSPPRSYAHLQVQLDFQGVGRQGSSRHQRSNELRELTLLGYLSQLQTPDTGPVRPLHSLTPYQVPHAAVALGVIHCEVTPNHMLYAANASLVGLCCLAEKVSSKGGPVLLSQAPICPCVGLGILRGIDMEQGLYLVLTPVEPSLLRKVNCLLLGSVSLPACILTMQEGFAGEVPYVTSDYSFELTGAGKLRVFRGLIRPSQMGT